MTYGLDGNGPVLLLRQPFQTRLKALVPASIPERKIKALEPYIYSIDHKLNVARYCAGLIRSACPIDYGKHLYASTPGGHSSHMEYTGRCIYFANDWDQYALSLLFFIESFAAAAFSLFDSSGHLLKEMYNLSIALDKTNFYEATQELRNQAPNFYNKFLSLWCYSILIL